MQGQSQMSYIQRFYPVRGTMLMPNYTEQETQNATTQQTNSTCILILKFCKHQRHQDKQIDEVFCLNCCLHFRCNAHGEVRTFVCVKCDCDFATRGDLVKHQRREKEE